MNPLLDLSARPIIAHRGAAAEAPENTLEAFRLAAAQGCDAFELDVRLSRDGVPVLLHDPTIDRTTDRTGAVRKLTLGELRGADAGARFVAPDGSRSFQGRGVRIPTLLEVLREFPGMPLLIEIKAPQAQQAIARLLEQEGAVARCVIAAFKAWALDAFRRAPFLVGASRRDILWLYVFTRLRLPAPTARCLCYAVPDVRNGREIPIPRLIAEARRHERPVHVWTVDSPDRARELWRRGVSGIITNRPGLMTRVREQCL